jgi:uncharacterized protein YndB with AHSA1/START domain
MTSRSVQHATFVIERTYPASPAHVFKAFSDPAAKAAWFAGPGTWKQADRSMDFRVGGREHLSGGGDGKPLHRFDAVYQDIVPGERIVYTYDMHIGDKRISVSLATVELRAEGTGTRVVVTEQGVFLDELDMAESRERGTRDLLDNLGKHLGQKLQ